MTRRKRASPVGKVWEDKGSRQGAPKVRVTAGSRLHRAAAGSLRPGHKMAAASPRLSVQDPGAGVRCCGSGRRQAARPQGVSCRKGRLRRRANGPLEAEGLKGSTRARRAASGASGLGRERKPRVGDDPGAGSQVAAPARAAGPRVSLRLGGGARVGRREVGSAACGGARAHTRGRAASSRGRPGCLP